ncbi:hypothetical protein AAC387_Pa06g1682 [Persea americana]
MAGAEEEVVNNQKRPMKESYIPLHTDQPSTILYPPNTAGNFTLSAQLLNMVPHYHGLPNEDPYLHIKEFFELCVTQQIQGVTPEGIRTRQMGKKQGVYEVQSQGNVTTQMAAMDKKIDMIIKAMASNSMLGQTSKEACTICSHTNHTTECCPISSFTDQEHANYVGNTLPKQNNPYSSTYNPGWRNHRNFSWGSNQNNQNNQGNQQQYQGQQRNYQHPQNNFSQNSAQKPPEDEFKSLVTQFIQSSQANF